MSKTDSAKKLPKKEIAWYVIASILAVAGITFMTFGIIGDHLSVKASDNWVLISESAWLSNWSGMGYRWWGIILLGAAVIVGVLSLTLFAREGDRDSERAARRAQRLAIEAEPAPAETVDEKAE